MNMRLICLFALVAIAGCESRSPVGPGRITITDIGITVNPTSTTMNVGQTVQLVAVVSGNSNQSVLWTSSNPAIASVTTTGIVQCVAAGGVTINGAAVVSPAFTANAAVTCLATATVSIQVTPTTLAFTHTVGSSPCPQIVGTAVVTSSSSGDVQVALTGPSTLNADATTFTLAPGATRTVALSFNCSTQTSFTGTVTFTATAGGASDAKTVVVTGTINR